MDFSKKVVIFVLLETFKQTSSGVTLVSGYSVNNVKMVLSGDVNPWTALKSVLESDRYNAIDTALTE